MLVAARRARPLLACFALLAACFAQQPSGADSADNPPSFFAHPGDTHWWVSGQANLIEQANAHFNAKYTGPNSLRPDAQARNSRVFTLYTGYQLTSTTEIYFDVESTGGSGISNALGLAGFTNLDVVRNPSLGSSPYISHLMVRQIIPLSRQMVESDRDQLSLATHLPAHRLEFRFGKFSMVDFFDQNAVGNDSHLQFLNWSVDNNGGYDYPADTRGYTWGVLADFETSSWGLRFAEALMPKEANGPDLDWNLRRARSENAEFELRPKIAGHSSTVRLLSYVNHANMGDYRESVRLFLQGVTPRPDIIATRQQGRIKYGFGVNLQQEITRNVRAYARFGWNEGHHESFAYTEVNQTVSFGTDVRGASWGRRFDRLGAAFVTNGISRDHQLYLKLGGLGFLLGDGTLNYGRENIVESYYTAHLWRGLYGSADLQHVNNPGFNRDRGPVWVPALRLHLEL